MNEAIAHEEGTLFTKWGPCYCKKVPAKVGEFCSACINCMELDERGLDYDDEREKDLARHA